MEFGLREVLIGVGFIVIVGILFDGYRRMRRSRQGELGLPSEMGGSCEDDGYYTGELPNGGSRRVSAAETVAEERVEPGFGDEALEPELPAEPDIREVRAAAKYQKQQEEQQQTSVSAKPVDLRGADTTESNFDEDGIGGVRRYSFDEPEQPEEKVMSSDDLFEDDEMLLSAKAAQEAKLAAHYRGNERKGSSSRNSKQPPPEARRVPEEDIPLNVDGLEEVIVLNLMAKSGEVFDGVDLEKALTSCGFRFGDMNIYHRYEQHVGRGPLLFSIANVVEPGTFDPDNVEEFSTPGVCMFMKLPGPKRSMHSFELMVECGKKIVSLLDGEMKDEHHSVMTQQTIEHYRQRVLDFDRKLLSHRVTQRS